MVGPKDVGATAGVAGEVSETTGCDGNGDCGGVGNGT